MQRLTGPNYLIRTFPASSPASGGASQGVSPTNSLILDFGISDLFPAEAGFSSYVFPVYPGWAFAIEDLKKGRRQLHKQFTPPGG